MPEPASTPAPHRITGPAELIDAIPYLLGFHVQSDSLVLVGLRGGQLVVTARADLQDIDAPFPSGDRLDDTLAALHRAGSTELVAVVYTAARPVPNRPLPRTNLADRLTALAESRALDVRDVLHVAGGQWWSYLCDSPDCCPPQGSAISQHTSAFAAEAVADGVAPLPDRAALAATLDPTGEQTTASQVHAAATAARRAALTDTSFRRGLARDLVTAASAGDPHRLTSTEVARYGVALHDIALRDLVWQAIDEQQIDGRDLWRALATRLPAPHSAAPLFLYAWASWRAGNGALAGIATDRALDSDPGYSAAHLLRSALAHGIDPRQLPRLGLQQSA